MVVNKWCYGLYVIQNSTNNEKVGKKDGKKLEKGWKKLEKLKKVRKVEKS